MAESQEAESWEELEERVKEVERFRIRAWREPFAPSDSWDDYIADEYPYMRAMPASTTVARFKMLRLEKHRPYFRFEVLRPDGSVAPGQMRLSKLRHLWATEEPPDLPPPEERILSWARSTRTTAWLLGAMNG